MVISIQETFLIIKDKAKAHISQSKVSKDTKDNGRITRSMEEVNLC